MSEHASGKDGWGSKLGLILAMAGNAVGLGNFWKFPYMAAGNGGGAFMIPYFIALLLLGFPIMVMEWQTGRFGGEHDENTLGAMVYLQARQGLKPKTALAIGSISGGLCFAITLLINSYYTHIVGWTLNYSVMSFAGDYMDHSINTGELFVGMISSPTRVFLFWIIVLIMLAYAVSRGISGGIEKWAKVMMPALYLFAIILVVAAFTTGSPVNPDWSALKGLNYVWNPDFSKLTWGGTMAACGQIFFSLSIGMGLICHYASYLKKEDDVVISSVSTVALNEFAEIVLAASIVIPIGYAYLGQEVLENAGPSLTFITLPNAFRDMPLGQLFGGLWFVLLFFAGFTSSMALYSYVTTFLSEIARISKKKASWIIMGCFLIVGFPVAFETILNKVGNTFYLDELDLWIGQYFLLILGLIEVIVFTRCMPREQQYRINEGALKKLPKPFFNVLLRYITPLMLIVVLIAATIERINSGAMALIPGGFAEDGSLADPMRVLWVNLARVVMIAIFVAATIITRNYVKHRYGDELAANAPVKE